jgi:hypothetical protein
MKKILVGIIKRNIILNKKNDITGRWFQFYINDYIKKHKNIKLKTAYLYLYSIDGRAYFETKKWVVQKNEIIKADINY